MKRNKIKKEVLDRVWELMSRNVPMDLICKRFSLNRDELEDQLENRLTKLDERDTRREREKIRARREEADFG